MNTTKQHVKLYDCDTEEVTTIPAAELAPGMVEVQIQGREAIEKFYWHPMLKAEFEKLAPEDFTDADGKVPIRVTALLSYL